jgi:hypothetical protein
MVMEIVCLIALSSFPMHDSECVCPAFPGEWLCGPDLAMDGHQFVAVPTEPPTVFATAPGVLT